MAPGSSEGTSVIEPWVPIEPICFVQARVYRPSSRESLLNCDSLFKRGYIDHWVMSPYWTIMFCSSEGISIMSRESLLNYYTTGTKKRKTLLGRAPPVQARVYRPSSRESLLNWYILFKRGYIDHRVVSPYWTHYRCTCVLCLMWLLLLFFMLSLRCGFKWILVLLYHLVIDKYLE